MTHDDVRRATAARGLLLVVAGRAGYAVHPLVAVRVLPRLSERVGGVGYEWAVVPVSPGEQGVARSKPTIASATVAKMVGDGQAKANSVALAKLA